MSYKEYPIQIKIRPSAPPHSQRVVFFFLRDGMLIKCVVESCALVVHVDIDTSSEPRIPDVIGIVFSSGLTMHERVAHHSSRQKVKLTRCLPAALEMKPEI